MEMEINGWTDGRTNGWHDVATETNTQGRGCLGAAMASASE